MNRDLACNGKDWPEVLKNTYKVDEIANKGVAVSFPATKTNVYGHIAYAKKILADGSIKLSEVNLDLKGSYRNDSVILKKDFENIGLKFIHFKNKIKT